MKKYLNLLIAFSILFACNKSEGVRFLHIQENDCEPLQSAVWQKNDNSRFYYDLRVTESYYAFLDEKSDTIIRIYKQDAPYSLYNFHIEKENNILNNKLLFLKSNTRSKAEENQLWIVEDKLAIKTINIENPTQLLSPTHDYPFKGLPLSAEFNLTKDEIYASPLNSTYNSPYYLYRPDSGYIRASVYKHADIIYPATGEAYVTSLIVSEENKRIVSAQRFMNDVLFYDLRGEIKTVVSFGEGHIIPETKYNKVDIENSKKCFIYICGTKEYVYCLYDGTIDYTANSKIVVFNWSGKHIKTFQADRCLKQIAVDKNNTKIIALAANEQHGRDVVHYQIKIKK